MNKKVFLIGFIIFVIILFVGAAGAAGYFYKQYNDIKNNPNKISTDEINSITSAIGKFMDLPTGETPTLATVTDKEKLKDQDFFKNSENGDKILIYANAKKAILYRPLSGKVIEVAPLLIGDAGSQSQEASPTGAPTEAPKEVPTETPTKTPIETSE